MYNNNNIIIVWICLFVHGRYVRSLARCIKYDAKGGKSRSTFCKVAGIYIIYYYIYQSVVYVKTA